MNRMPKSILLYRGLHNPIKNFWHKNRCKKYNGKNDCLMTANFFSFPFSYSTYFSNSLLFFSKSQSFCMLCTLLQLLIFTAKVPCGCSSGSHPVCVRLWLNHFTASSTPSQGAWLLKTLYLYNPHCYKHIATSAATPMLLIYQCAADNIINSQQNCHYII